ncbi:MAG: ABC transporter permease [Burkholderiales bacterium]|nr:ABC transporter permease [Burkholderiales bacterium]
MLRYALQRGLTALLVAVTVSIATFFLLDAAGDPAEAIAGPDAPRETIEQIRAQYGFDRPWPVRYGEWALAVAGGDLGTSFLRRQPVGELIATHAPVTITLAFSALAVTILVAIPLGVAAALRPDTWVDRWALALAVAAQAVPSFWLGLVLIVLFAVTFPVFPVSGDTSWLHFVLPALVLGTTSVPAVMRLTRTGLLEVMASDYIRTARAKGYTGAPLIVRQALRNALLPVVGVLAVQLGGKLGGSVITESVFALNGLGRLALEAIVGSDIPTLQMLVFVFALTFVVLTFLADLLNAWLDPRVRLA